ncbi:MAG: peptidoglycan D,D-transpeptidase FtsI family protein [Thermomicrobiales bacterium]
MPRAVRTIALLGALALLLAGLASGSEITDARWLGILGTAWLLLILAVWFPLPAKLPRFNRSVIRTAMIVTTVFCLLTAQLVRIQIVQGNAVANRVAEAPNGETLSNGRLLNTDLTVRRGRVYDRSGVLLADSVQENGAWSRVYPEPASAYVVGYHAPLTVGADGLEATEADVLSGEESGNMFERWARALLHRSREGNDVVLTLDADLQRTAQAVLGERAGAAVLVEVETGRVLALASYPYYDPNQLVATTPDQAAEAEAYWAALLNDEGLPLVQRATDGLYAPGSIFKVITAATAIELGFASPEKVYEDDGSLDVAGRVIVEHNRPDARTEWTLAESLAWSLNVVFARVGLAIGAENLTDFARRFGFGVDVPFDLPVSESQLASSDDFLDTLPAVADTAFGQGELLVSPLHMAMVAAGIANGGSMMRPMLVDSVVDPSGTVQSEHEPEAWLRPISPETAAAVEGMMVGAVETGYASAAGIPGIRVGGKTGTAEVANAEPHAWFIGFAGTPQPEYAVAVVLENAGAGMAGSQLVGRDLLQAAVQGSLGQLGAYVRTSEAATLWPNYAENGRILHGLLPLAYGPAGPAEKVRGHRQSGGAIIAASGVGLARQCGDRRRRRAGRRDRTLRW